MTSVLNSAGLQIDSKSTIIAALIASMQSIYGSDINVASNSPDGQLINIFAQADEDFLELLLDAYNACAVPTSYGARLDQLVALNGLARQQGTFTQANVLVTVTQALTLPGLDQTALTPFTVSDNAGNQFELVTSYVFGGSGSATLVFQAVTIGQIQTTANTITNIITSTLGVSTVNNPSTSSDVVGVNEETDSQLKTRHSQSFQLASTGPSDSMESQLKNIADVVDAIVVENNTGSPVNTVPAYSVWPIVNGGTAVEIAAAIYAKKSPGCGLKGSVTQVVARPNGATFTAQWDVALTETLYLKFGIIWRGPQALSNASIQTMLAAALPYKLGQNPNVGDLVVAMQAIAPTAIVTFTSNEGVSTDNSTFTSLVTPSDAAHYFTLIAANITIA